MTIVGGDEVVTALSDRLRKVVSEILPDPAEGVTSSTAGDLLDTLVSSVRASGGHDRLWLLLVALSGSFPTSDDFLAASRVLRSVSVLDATLWMLDYALASMRTRQAHRGMKIVSSGVVVDVDHSACHDLHTGIQEVVRRLLPLWSRDHPVEAVAWTTPVQALRTLDERERGRVFRWTGPVGGTGMGRGAAEIVVPWRSVVVLPEVPFPDACDRLAGLARFSGNSVVTIGYDCIPAVSGDLVPVSEANRFVRYLGVVKFARRVAAIGSTAKAEFTGFSNALLAQGLLGPSVVEIPLPSGQPQSRRAADLEAYEPPGPPLVLCVGTIEPRKNQGAILFAAERLWREGLEFELRFISGSGWDPSVPVVVARLQARGRRVSIIERARAEDVTNAYRDARFTVFPSLHEGFGLPIAESFEQGTPVITSSFGSMAEVASEGGAILVDPRDEDELIAAMRALLTDDDLLCRLRSEIAKRPTRTWGQYATELWLAIVAPELAALARERGGEMAR